MTFELVAREARENGLVVFAGAGLSMAPPSSLPGWFDLNRMILDALMRRVGDYTERHAELEQLFELLIDRRDKRQNFPPEYQAQVMEEQIGLTYFRALQALDVPQRNAAHEALATLASAGSVRAIVTTNFDQLIEGALTDQAVEYSVHFDQDGYQALAAALAEDGVGRVPVVKIHGSVEDASSLVDTLRQRLRGRGPALEAALRPLLMRHYWVFCGFSGADLDFDPDYLGLRSAAEVARGFSFVHLPSSPPRASVRLLGDAYGSKATFAGTTLDDWFAGLAAALDVELPPAPPMQIADPSAAVAAALSHWAAALHPMEAVNTSSALLEAGGEEPAAFWLLRQTWKWFRRPEDTSGPAYARFLLNYGRLALALGDEQDGETVQNFLRTYGDIPEAPVYAGLYFAYAGSRAEALGFFREAAERAEAHGSATLAAELALALSRYARIYGERENVLGAINWALQRVTEDGDLPRRGRLLAGLAFIYAGAGITDEAEKAADEAESIAERIGDDVLSGEVALARGVALFSQNDYDGARRHLREAATIFAPYKRLPLSLDAALEWIEAAYMAGEDDEAWEVYQDAESALMPAYAPRLYLIMGRWYANRGEIDNARRNFEHAAEQAERLDNDWMRAAVEATLAQLSTR